MRILVSNPDTVGDTVLRQPLYAALLGAGHELTILARPMAAPLIPLVAPGANVLTVDAPIYDLSLGADARSLGPVVSRARALDPDVLLVAPYQWTVLEERLSAELPRARCIAMSGHVFYDEAYAPPRPSTLRVDETVDVEAGAPELAKNAALASAVLGRRIEPADPRLEPTEAMLEAARGELDRAGLEAGHYWAACLWAAPSLDVRNWHAERWSHVLREWGRLRDRRFLLMGHTSEREGTLRIRDGLGDESGRAATWFGEAPDSLVLLIGLLALSAGYVGRDTGPMHLAAALGRPVLAVFGGGTWGRFLPAVDPSVSITVGVPCAGCGWRCHLSESVCVKEVPAEEVLRGAEDLESGAVRERTVRVLEPAPALLARIGAEGAAAARRHMARAALLGRERGWKETLMGGDAQAIEALIERTVRDAAEANTRAGRAEQRAQQATQELERLRPRAAELEAQVAELVRARAQQAAQLAATRDSLLEAQGRLAHLEKKLQERAQELAEVRGHLAQRTGEIQVLRARLEAEAPAVQRLKQSDAEQRRREARLQDELARAQAEAGRLQAELADVRVRLERLEQERAALAAVSRQQENEIALLRTRVRDLLASRWRKIGQRLHLAMTLPWEQEMQNGRH